MRDAVNTERGGAVHRQVRASLAVVLFMLGGLILVGFAVPSARASGIASAPIVVAGLSEVSAGFGIPRRAPVAGLYVEVSRKAKKRTKTRVRPYALPRPQDDAKSACISSGGAWTGIACVRDANPEQECRKSGGAWTGLSCVIGPTRCGAGYTGSPPNCHLDTPSRLPGLRQPCPIGSSGLWPNCQDINRVCAPGSLGRNCRPLGGGSSLDNIRPPMRIIAPSSGGRAAASNKRHRNSSGAWTCSSEP